MQRLTWLILFGFLLTLPLQAFAAIDKLVLRIKGMSCAF